MWADILIYLASGVGGVGIGHAINTIRRKHRTKRKINELSQKSQKSQSSQKSQDPPPPQPTQVAKKRTKIEAHKTNKRIKKKKDLIRDYGYGSKFDQLKPYLTKEDEHKTFFLIKKHLRRVLQFDQLGQAHQNRGTIAVNATKVKEKCKLLKILFKRPSHNQALLPDAYKLIQDVVDIANMHQYNKLLKH